MEQKIADILIPYMESWGLDPTDWIDDISILAAEIIMTLEA